MILPRLFPFEQGSAQDRAVSPPGLSPATRPCHCCLVIVAQTRAWGVSPVCYPSPAGRGGFPQGCPPCFFSVARGGRLFSKKSTKRRPLPILTDMRAAKTAHVETKRGKETCIDSRNGLLGSAPLHCWQAAATRLENKRSWAGAPALPPRRSPRATWRQARSSVLLATSPIVRNTRRAAEQATLAAPAAANITEAISGRGPGVAFYVLAGGASLRRSD